MGLGGPLAWGIIMFGIIIVSFTVISISDSTLEVIDTMEKPRINNESIKNTQIQISNLITTSANDVITFNLDSDGSHNLWNFKNFDLFITYDADIEGVPTRVTEKLNNPETSALPGVTFDAVTLYTNDACDSCGFSHTVTASDDDRLLIVGVTPEKIASLSSVTYDDQSLTKIRSDEYSGISESSLWYLLNPNIGSNTIAATFSESGEVIIGAVSFSKVNQTSAIYQHAGANGTSTTPTTNVDATCNTLIVGNLSTLDGPLSTNSGQTEHWNTNFNSMMGAGSSQIIYAPGTYPTTWTNSAGTKEFAISTAVIKPTNGMYCLDNGEWNISILNDVKEPGIINKDEISLISARVQYPIESGTVIVQFGTDNGVTASSFITVS